MTNLIATVALAASFSTAALAAPKTETLRVSGWHCENCSARTESALKAVKGVTAVSADKKTDAVTVTYDDSKVKRADLEKAVAKSGFELEK